MKNHVNLLPATTMHGQNLFRIAWIWSLVALTTLAGLSGFVWAAHTKSIQAKAEERILSREYAQYKGRSSELKELESRIQELDQRDRVALRLANKEPMLDLLGSVSKAARANDGILVESLKFENGNATGRSTRRGNFAHGLILSGIAKDNLTIAKFSAALRDANLFESVGLESSNEVSVADSNIAESRSFLIHCSLASPAEDPTP